MSVQLHTGDCLDVLRSMPDDSVDSFVCDPPYGLSFMGKAWDGAVPSVEVWREALRVLKPGGHLLAFAGTRTQHRMAVAIEDAGFEIRDMIAWTYGSGFPKSHDVAKGIDKMDAGAARMERRYRFTEWFSSVWPHGRKFADYVCGTSDMGRHWTDIRPSGKQPDIPTRPNFEALRPYIVENVPAWVEELVDERTVESENYARREVIGSRTMRDTSQVSIAVAHDAGGYDASARRDVDETTAYTEAAQKWDGWGTALKPALEPITVARKPLVGTVAANVLAHGTGALNIDACRIAHASAEDAASAFPGGRVTSHGKGSLAGPGSAQEVHRAEFNAERNAEGRWPANLIHDGSDEVLAVFPEAPGQQADASTSASSRETQNVYGAMKRGRGEEASADSANDGVVGFKMRPGARRMDSGSAARFFYCAKATKADRDDGLDHLDARPSAAAEFRPNHAEKAEQGEDGNPYGRWQPRKNAHPTVKPTALMRHLCRLVTPPSGTVCDPFMGSGSTGRGAVWEGFSFIGIELDPEHVEVARLRIAAAERTRDAEAEEARRAAEEAARQPDLFAGAAE